MTVAPRELDKVYRDGPLMPLLEYITRLKLHGSRNGVSCVLFEPARVKAD